MRNLKNINPELTSELLDKCGLKFDGYYYTNSMYPFQLHKEDDGYVPSFKDPGLPSMPVVLTDYTSLIAFMYSAIQFSIPMDIQTKKLSPDEKSIAQYVKNWWGFDKDLKFVLVSNENGLVVVPNDEYTYSLINGSIKEVKVEYNWEDTNTTIENNSLEFEVTLNCISWPFLCEYIMNNDERVKSKDGINIFNVKFKNDDKWVPFFGMGIPKART